MNEELIAENSKLREVLTKISELDYKNAATNGAAFEAVKLAAAALHKLPHRLTSREIIAVVQAYKEGKSIESCPLESIKGQWYPCANPAWDFYHYAYRVVPEPKPKVEPVEFYVNLYDESTPALVTRSCYPTADEAFANRVETARYIRTILVREVPDDRCSELSRE
jgi:hypothetical protein